MKKILVFSVTTVIVITLCWTYSLAQNPMPGADAKIGFVSNIVEAPNYFIGYEDLISMSVAMYRQTKNQRYAVTMSAGGITLFYPGWEVDDPSNILEHLIDPGDADSLGMFAQNLFNLEFNGYYKGNITFDAYLYEKRLGPSGSDWIPASDPASYVLGFDAVEPPHPCRNGSMIVDVNGIPGMNDGNKDSINKTCFFCIRDENDIAFIAVYHRYVQPNWPYGEWWVTWRMEAGANGCVKEYDIWSSSPLPGSSATFLVEWNNKVASVTHTGTGDRQTLHTENILGLDFMYEDGGCSSWGWSSEAVANGRAWTCDEVGGPTYCYQ